MSTEPLAVDERTLSAPLTRMESAAERVLGLTVMWHPEARLIGGQATCARRGEPWPLSRTSPAFRAVDDTRVDPLGHPAISRAPTVLAELADGSVHIEFPANAMHCEIDGRRVAGALTLGADEVDRGVVLIYGGAIALCLHRVSTLPDGAATSALAGLSSAMVRVRRQVAQVAATELPVLVLGESGSGKERVAQAVHARSRRAAQPLVAVNMAALTDSLAAADLFGTTRGAFTGAQAARPGYWREAEGGTLFLDEIGDTAALVQPMLLRAIETRRFRPLGALRDVEADVRLVAATDRDLQASGFNQPLMRRLEAFVIHLPPLRARREDFGLLALRFLGEALARPPTTLALPAPLVRALCLFDWPGNVRQLMHAMRRIALGLPTGDWPTVADLLGQEVAPRAAAAAPAAASTAVPAQDIAVAAAAPGGAGRRRYRLPSTVTSDELVAALEAAGWRLSTAAEQLGISRPSLYNLMRQHPGVRSVQSLQRGEVERMRAAGVVDLDAMASHLRVAREALRRRLLDWEATDSLQAAGAGQA